MKRVQKLIALLLALTLILPVFAFAETGDKTTLSTEKVLERVAEKFKPELEADRVKLEADLEQIYKDDDEVRIIVELKSKPSIVYATERNISYENMSKSLLSSIEQRIEFEQKELKNLILSRNVEMKFINSFKTTFNGFSGIVKFEDIKVIESLPQVNKVYIANEYERPETKPNLGTSNDMIGALPTWDTGYKGEGTVVAIIDTGIDPSHRDMVLSEGVVPKLTRQSLQGKGLLGRYYTPKVPYGFNYYDMNHNIVDQGPDPSMHGMHVAGIAGANGDPDNGGIKGVAPEAQLLAMKVFSNDPFYATTFSDIYLVAIDEAVRLGADVINMSLGSTSGFYIEDSAENRAITNATDNGIVCAVSAGNSGSMTYGWSATNYGYPWKENPDIGVVGSPGLNKDTIQVASIENTHKKVNALSYEKEGEVFKIPMAIAGNINPIAVFDGPQEFVDGGDGSPEFLTDVEGKIVLVVRGGNTGPFVGKIQNAQNAGAIGIIVRNHQDGGEELVNMATPDVQTIPAVFIGYSGGLELLQLENKMVEFLDEMLTIPNATAGEMSDFTSWGVTPSLDLKPEITAPGGEIYSTLNDDKYGTMSGTSMAAPHVAGGSAVVMEYIKEHELYGNLSLAEQTRLAKVLLMNTAEIVYDEYDTEYSPRRQGAGLMNLYGAVSTPVRLVDASTNEAKVELRDFTDTEFTMRFKAINDSDTDVVYNVDISVLADYIYAGLNLLVSDYIYGAEIIKPDTITVPANGECIFEVTVDIGTDPTVYRNMFVEGFVSLVDPNDINPDLSVPYVGFYGDWGEPRILDGMRFIDPAGESYYEMSGMIFWNAYGAGYYYTTPHIYMNPGTIAGYLEGTGNITPYLSFMRNAEWVDYNILDEEGNLLRTLYKQQFRRKNFYNAGRNSPVSMISNAEWDGTVNGEFVPDGNYFYEIAAKVHYDGAEVQSKRIPITVDTLGPEIKDIAFNPTTCKLTWTSVDEGAGILGFIFAIDGEDIDEVVYGEDGKTSYELDMRPYLHSATEYNIEIISVDNLLNTNYAEFTFCVEDADAYIYLYSPGLLETYTTNDILVQGYVANMPTLDKVLLNEVEADIEFMEDVVLYHPDDPSMIVYMGPAFKFTKTLNIEDGYQELQIEAVSITGARSSLVRRFYVDTTPPELNIAVSHIDKDLAIAELEIEMMDALGSLALFLGDSQIFVYDHPMVIVEPAHETITYDVNLEEGENTFVFTLRDGAGHKTVEIVTITLDLDEEEPDPEVPGITNIEPSRDYELSPGDSLDISFNAPAGGSGYYKILLPLEIGENSLNTSGYGTPMTEVEPGFYKATWTVPEGLVASGLLIELVYLAEDGEEIYATVPGKVTIIGSLEEMPVNSVIIGNEAFDMDVLETNANAQRKFIEWANQGKPVYIKISERNIVDMGGKIVSTDLLPARLTHIDSLGTIRIFQIH
ncbi:MAG: S8 family serine peptidase [Tissierellia bacterium]|nr:S8 family serine peptidase [Tissierellia bacterium]